MAVKRNRIIVPFVDKYLDGKDKDGKDIKETVTKFTTCTKDTADFFAITSVSSMELEDTANGETFVQLRRGSRYGKSFQVITNVEKRAKDGTDIAGSKGRRFSFQFPGQCTLIDIITFLKRGVLTKNKDKIIGFVSPHGVIYSYEDKTTTDDTSKITPRRGNNKNAPDSVDDGSK